MIAEILGSHRERLGANQLAVARIALVFGMIMGAVALSVYPHWTMDDAYISLRYAQNLAIHGGMTWNPGGDRVEGYTGVLLPLLEALAIRLGWSGLSLSQILGAGALLSSGPVLYATLRRLSVHPLVLAAAVLLFYANPFNYSQASSGLETSIFMLGLLVALYCLVRVEGDPSPRRQWLLMLALVALGFVRPESLAVAVVFLAAAAWTIRSSRMSLRAFLLRAGVGYLAPTFAYLAFRLAYYGNLLPNTFYAKRATWWVDLESLSDMVSFVATCVLLPVAIVLLVRSMSGQPRPRLPVSVKAATVLVVVILAAYARSHLFQNIGYRFFVPLFPLALVTMAVLAGEPGPLFGRERAASRVPYLIAAVLLVQVMVNGYFGYLQSQLDAGYATLIADEHRQAGLFLRANVSSDRWLAVCIDAGAIPYYSGLPTLDMGGLNDAFLAQGRKSAREQMDYLFAHDPGAIVLTSDNGEKPVSNDFPIVAIVAADPRFARYRLVKSYGTDANGYTRYHELVYVRG